VLGCSLFIEEFGKLNLLLKYLIWGLSNAKVTESSRMSIRLPRSVCGKLRLKVDEVGKRELVLGRKTDKLLLM
jgi:hypothetical protein